MRIRHLTLLEWAVTITALWLALGLGLVFDIRALLLLATLGFGALTIERVVRWARNQRPETCGELLHSHSGHASHPCARPADGHTMHRCVHGDCSWGF